MRLFLRILYPTALIALAVGICWELVVRIGAGVAMGVWCGGMGVLCAVSAWLLSGAPVGAVNWRNRLAGYLLPWGFRLGRGKLVASTIFAWVIWCAIGLATIGVLARPRGAAGAHPALATMLLVSWMILGALIVRQLGLMPTFGSSHGRRSLAQSALVLAGLMVGSAGLWFWGWPGKAVILAGGPIAAVGGGYGLFLVVMLTVGRRARWN